MIELAMVGARKVQQYVLTFLTFVLVGLSFGPVFAAPSDRPNLLFIYADQMRGDAMGWVEDGLPVETPNLDRLADQSVAFTDAVANYPVCTPWRAMFMTGQYPIRNGVVGNAARGRPENELPDSARTWSRVLDEAGYSLGYIGKWHLEAAEAGHIPPGNKWNVWTPPNRRFGFDYWYAYGSYNHHDWPMYWTTDAPRDGYHFVDQWEPKEDADRAIEFIRNEDGTLRKPDEPWGLVVATNPPHRPYRRVPSKYKKMYDDLPMSRIADSPAVPPENAKWGRYFRFHIRNYMAMVTGVDRQVGRILDALRRQGMADNTLVIFASDHGDNIGMHNEIAKSNPFEEAFQVPLMMRFPGRLDPREEDLLISTPDLYPTMLGLLEMEDQIPDEVTGRNYAPLLTKGEGQRPTSQLYLEVSRHHLPFGERGVRTGRYTLAISKNQGKSARFQLWDRKRDPHQVQNIAPTRPKLVNRLVRDELIPWLEKTDDPWLNTLQNRIELPDAESNGGK